MFNLIFDHHYNNQPWPNLAPMPVSDINFRSLGNTYPWIGPLRLLYYCNDHNYPVNILYVSNDLPNNSFYPVGICWFDFSIDYFALMSSTVIDLLKNKKLKVLFYYHEGDNPFKEKKYLDQLCKSHNLPEDCYIFISGNTQADEIENFVYFPDHELFFWRNSVVSTISPKPGCKFHKQKRSKDFTMLSRIHKWWRATAMTRMHQLHLLDNSFWSYNKIDIGDCWESNPIQTWQFENFESDLNKFLNNAPYTCDSLTSDDHNNHRNLVPEHYEDSYCNLVLETLYDCEQSNGAFITEKTFKPIRHGQPFIVFGAVNTLKTLRSLGYRTYDHCLDNSYDSIDHNTKRFEKTIDTIVNLKKQNLDNWIRLCEKDAIYNQQLFLSSKYSRIDKLNNRLLFLEKYT